MRLTRVKYFSQIIQLINGKVEKVEIKTRECDSGVCLLYELREKSGAFDANRNNFPSARRHRHIYQLTSALNASIQ